MSLRLLSGLSRSCGPDPHTRTHIPPLYFFQPPSLRYLSSITCVLPPALPCAPPPALPSAGLREDLKKADKRDIMADAKRIVLERGQPLEEADELVVMCESRHVTPSRVKMHASKQVLFTRAPPSLHPCLLPACMRACMSCPSPCMLLHSSPRLRCFSTALFPSSSSVFVMPLMLQPRAAAP